LKLDHLTIIAPTLEAGREHVYTSLGVELPFGGCHPEMGTHNLLARLSDNTFLEVIAIDPTAEHIRRPRWFGLDDKSAVQQAWNAGYRLRGWVAQTSDIDAKLLIHANILGSKVEVSRGDRSWLISVPQDGSLPMNGVAPSIIDWGPRGTPAVTMIDIDLTLVDFRIQHPEPTVVKRLYENLGVNGLPRIQAAKHFGYKALIQTHTGIRELY
jgi:hypothetical protein